MESILVYLHVSRHDSGCHYFSIEGAAEVDEQTILPEVQQGQSLQEVIYILFFLLCNWLQSKYFDSLFQTMIQIFFNYRSI